MSDIRWVAVIALAPMGGADRVLAEFTAPDKRAANAELERRIAADQLPQGARVLSRLDYELHNAPKPQAKKAAFFGRR